MNPASNATVLTKTVSLTHFPIMLFLTPSLQLARTSPAMLLGVRQPCEI
jgi:hypothetical protein